MSYPEDMAIFLTLHLFPISCRCLAAELFAKLISIKYERTVQRDQYEHALHKNIAVLMKRTACSSPHLFMLLCQIHHLVKLSAHFLIPTIVLTDNYS